MAKKGYMEENINWFLRLSATKNRWLYKVTKRGSDLNKTNTSCFIVKYADVDREGNLSLVDSEVIDQVVFRKRKGVIIEVTDKEIWDIIMEQGHDLTKAQRQKDFEELRTYFDKPIEDDEPRWCSPRDTTASGDIWIPLSDNELHKYVKAFEPRDEEEIAFNEMVENFWRCEEETHHMWDEEETIVDANNLMITNYENV